MNTTNLLIPNLVAMTAAIICIYFAMRYYQIYRGARRMDSVHAGLMTFATMMFACYIASQGKKNQLSRDFPDYDFADQEIEYGFYNQTITNFLQQPECPLRYSDHMRSYVLPDDYPEDCQDE